MQPTQNTTRVRTAKVTAMIGGALALAVFASGCASSDPVRTANDKAVNDYQATASATPTPNKPVTTPTTPVLVKDKAASDAFGKTRMAALGDEMTRFTGLTLANQTVASNKGTVAEAVGGLPIEGVALTTATRKPTLLMMDTINGGGAKYAAPFARVVNADKMTITYRVDQVAGQPVLVTSFTGQARVWFTQDGVLKHGDIERDFTLTLTPNTDEAAHLSWSVANFKTSPIRSNAAVDGK